MRHTVLIIIDAYIACFLYTCVIRQCFPILQIINLSISGERINFSYLVTNKYVGEKVQMEILKNDNSAANKNEKEVGTRKKKVRDKKTKLQVVEIVMGNFNRLVPMHIEEKPPSYLIIGGLVFTCCTLPYLKSEYGKDFDYEAPVSMRVFFSLFDFTSLFGNFLNIINFVYSSGTNAMIALHVIYIYIYIYLSS